MNVYLDTCCYNRIYDDRSNIKNYLEREAVLIIMEQAYKGFIDIVGSVVVDREIFKIKDKMRLKVIYSIYIKLISEKIESNEMIEMFAEKIRKFTNVKFYDSWHLASALMGADYLITTDNKFLKNGNKISGLIPIMNPVNFVMEVLYGNE